MTAIEDKYVFTTAEESVVRKDWAAGSSKQTESREFVITRTPAGYTADIKTVKYAPAWWKIIDEPIVNALDHLVRQLGTPSPVNCIKVSFEPTGRVKIYNNGPGVEVQIHKTASEKLGREIYVPTFIFGILFQGSNRERKEDSIIGGTNGLGAKLCKCFSTEFIVETVRDGKYFLQRWKNENGQSIETPPVVMGINDVPNERRHEHTTLSFVPDYCGIFGYNNGLGASEYAMLVEVIRTRVFFASAYAHYAINNHASMNGIRKKQAFEIWFNDEKINITSMNDIASIMFPGANTITTRIAPKNLRPWEITAVITHNNYEQSQLSNVNGIMVRDGKHFKHIMNVIVNSVREKITKVFNDKELKFSPKYVSDNVFLLMNTQVPNPGWTGQRKDVLDTDVRKFEGYQFDTKFINTIADNIRDQIIDSIFKDSKKKKKSQTEYDKYIPAKLAGTRRSSECMLIAVEGDSAMTQVATGMAHSLGFDRYGVISLGGVIMNARKECTVVETTNGQMVKKSTKLDKNIFMNVLCEKTGLNTSYRYDPKSPTYKKEMSELMYGSIGVMVDQDHDGLGNIFSLLLSVFDLFWGNLLDAGFIKWGPTPIKRAYPKRGGKVVSFYTEIEYDEWEKTVNTSDYVIKYYKGIGTHSRDETINMFSKFRENLHTYYRDARSRELFEIYLGTDPDKRKIELSKPTKPLDPAKILEQERTKKISCSDHLEYHANLYQKDNLERKLDHVIDGQNQAGRKILDGLIKALKGNKEMKVAQLSGYISEHENYHHGEASLADSITGRGLVTTGGKQIPIIVPLSNFGSRKEGGNDAASARYIWAKLNKRIVNLIFPESDYWILQFNIDEGKRSEPKYFVPIIPMAVLESTELPAHGWKLKTWGRDVFKVIENVRRLIRLGDNVPLLKMPPAVYAGSPYEWKGKFKTIRGDIYSFGNYTIKSDILRITELPLREWTRPYVLKIKAKANNDDRIIEDVNDLSDDISVNIEVKLKPGALDILNTMADSVFSDGVEEYFLLRDRMDSHINLMGVSGEVISFNNYEDVLYEWFPVRKEYYRLRIVRERVLLQLKVKLMENQIRYIEYCNSMTMSRRREAEQIKLLEDNKFDKIHSAKIYNPEFTETEKLVELIMNGPGADYDYLLNLSDKAKNEESYEKYQVQLQKLQDDIIELDNMTNQGRFPGAVLFERELDELETTLREGFRTFWKYSDESKFQFD